MAEKSSTNENEILNKKDENTEINSSKTHQSSSNPTVSNIRVTDLLRRAYEEKNFVMLDEIVEDMVNKSYVDGLKKLHTACGYGFSELVEQYLTKEKIDPNSECSFNDLNNITPLHFCAGIGPDQISPDRDKCIQLLIRHGANINHVTSRQDTALHWATKLADFKVCEQLVKSGIDLTILNVDSCTAAHGAAFYKRIELLEMLIENKIDVNVKDISGKNILHLLCKDQAEDFSIIKSESEVNLSEKQLNSDGTDTLSMKKKYLNFINRLLTEFKMNSNEKDTSDFTPLMYACEHNNLDLVKLLHESNGDLHGSNREHVTCMLLAVVNSCPLVVDYLIKNGFDVKTNTGQNVSYLTDAAYLNDIEILNMLLDAGCDVNETKQDENGVILNPLWSSVERTNISVAELLLSRGANAIIRPDLQMTALHCAAMAQYECLTLVKLLVEHKCPLNMKSTQAGETPLFLASNSGFAEIVEYLLDQGVDVNDASPPSRTCFQQALFRGHKEIIVLLINRGYKLNEEDKNDLNLFIMDLYQDNDVEMLNFLLNKNLTDKQKILECIGKIDEWQTTTQQQHNQQISLEEASSKGSNSESSVSSATTSHGCESSSMVATLTNLSLDLSQPQQHSHPKTIAELDLFLQFQAVPISRSHSSDGSNHELQKS